MTVSSLITAKQYTSNGATTQYAFPNKIFAATDLVVTLIDLVGNQYAFTNFANAATGLSYSVQGVDVDTGCTVVFSGVQTSGWTVDIRTITADTQSTSIKNQGQFLPELHEEAFDRATRQIQDLLRLTYTYGIHGPDIESTPWNPLPVAAVRAGTMLTFDGNGSPLCAPQPNNGATQSQIGQLLYPRTAAEIAGSVTPANYAYAPGNVFRYGAKGDGSTDDSNAFQNAVNGLPTAGGLITVPDFSYVINTAPTWGTKSVYWNIGTRASFSGTQTTFPRMNTNAAQVPVGPWIQSQSTVASPGGGGIAALNVEMIQPATYVGQSVALFTGARGSNSNSSANVWSINCLIQADPGAGGTYQCIEVDANNNSTSALVKGISINGVGSQNASVGLEIIRSAGSWNSGITINNSVLGISIGTTGINRGISIGNPLVFASTLISGKQLANNVDSIILQRNTDSSPTGFFLRGVNAANNATVFQVDVNGGAAFNGFTQSPYFQAINAAPTAGAGQINYGATTATSATAGANGAVPAQVDGYIIINVAGTGKKIPYFNM